MQPDAADIRDGAEGTALDETVPAVDALATASRAEAGRTMSDIVGSIRRVTDIVGGIATASGGQSDGVAQVGEAVAGMDRATQQNAALVEQSAAASDPLSQQADERVKAVDVFRLARG